MNRAVLHKETDKKREFFPSVPTVHKNNDRFWVGVVLIELVVLYFPTLIWLFERWTMSVWQNAHGLFIPPIFAYLSWQKLDKLIHLGRKSSAWGFAFLIPAIGLYVIDIGIHTQLLSAISLVLILPGLSLLFLGTRRTKAIGFLFVFLAFMIPIPLGLTENIHLILRKITAVNASFIIPIFGIPIFLDGTMIHLPNARLLVADACSGFSTLYATAAIGFLTVHLTSVFCRKILVLIAIVPIAIAANSIRTIFLILLVYWEGVEVLKTFLHPLSGILAIGLALSVIFWVGQISYRPKSRMA